MNFTNPNLKVKLEKIVVDCCIGNNPEKLKLCNLSFKKFFNLETELIPAKKTLPAFDIRRKMNIGFKALLRSKSALDFLKHLDESGFEIANIDKYGYTRLGLKEYHQMKKHEYDPLVPNYGYNITISFKKLGTRVKYKRRGRNLVNQIVERELVEKFINEYVR